MQPKFVTLLFDIAALAGAALVTTGLWWIYPPAALIALGVAILALGLWGAKLWAS